MQDWEIVNSSKCSFKLLYLRFPPLQIRTFVFRTCVFSRPVFTIMRYTNLRTHSLTSTRRVCVCVCVCAYLHTSCDAGQLVRGVSVLRPVRATDQSPGSHVSTEHRLHRVGDLADRGAGARRRDRQLQQVAVARLTTLGDLRQTPLQLQYKPRRQTPPPAPVLPPGESL